MKKFIVGFLAISLIANTAVKADEGMWIPMLLKQWDTEAFSVAIVFFILYRDYPPLSPRQKFPPKKG